MGYSVLTLVVIAWLCMTTRKERRQQRAVDRGFVSSCPKGFRFLAVPSSLYSRVRAQRDALAEHERCNIISGKSHHFLAQAIESAASARGRSITRRARSLNSRAATKRHNWPSAGSGASSAGSEVDDFTPQVLSLCELIGEPSNLFQLHSFFFNGLFAGSDEEFDDCPSSISSGITTVVDEEVLGDSLHECGGPASCELATEIDITEEFSLVDEGIIDTFLHALCSDSGGNDTLASVDSADVSIGVGDTLHASLDGGDYLVGDGGCKALAEDSASQPLIFADAGSRDDSDDDDFAHDEGFQDFADVELDGRASSALAGASQVCDLGNLPGSAFLLASLDGGDTLDAVGGCKALAEDSAFQRLIWADVGSSGDSDDEDFMHEEGLQDSDVDPDGRASSAVAGASHGCVLGNLHGSSYPADNKGWCLVDGIWSKRAGCEQRELTCSPDPTGVPDEAVVDKKPLNPFAGVVRSGGACSFEEIMKNTMALVEDSAHVMHDTEAGSLIVASGPLPSALAGVPTDVPVLDVTEIADEQALTEGADFVALAEESASSSSCNASAALVDLGPSLDSGVLHEEGKGCVQDMHENRDGAGDKEPLVPVFVPMEYVAHQIQGALTSSFARHVIDIAYLKAARGYDGQYIRKLFQKFQTESQRNDDLHRRFIDAVRYSTSLKRGFHEQFKEWSNGFKSSFAKELANVKEDHQKELESLKGLNNMLILRLQEQDRLHDDSVKPYYLRLHSLHEVLHDLDFFKRFHSVVDFSNSQQHMKRYRFQLALPIVGGHTGIASEAHHSADEGRGSEKWRKRKNKNKSCRKRCSEFKLVHADHSVVGSSANVDAEQQNVLELDS